MDSNWHTFLLMCAVGASTELCIVTRAMDSQSSLTPVASESAEEGLGVRSLAVNLMDLTLLALSLAGRLCPDPWPPVLPPFSS